MRTRVNLKNIFLPPLSSSHLYLLPSAVQGDREWGSGQFITGSFSHCSGRGVPLLQGRALPRGDHGKVSNVSPSREQQFSTNYCNLCHSSIDDVLQAQPAPAWGPQRVTGPTRNPALEWTPLSTGLQVPARTLRLALGHSLFSGTRLLQPQSPWTVGGPLHSLLTLDCRGTAASSSPMCERLKC